MVKKHISGYIDEDFHEQIKAYCRKHQISITSFVGEALTAKLNNDFQAGILEKCERLIEAKLPSVINIKARKV